MLKRSLFIILAVLFMMPIFATTVVYGETGTSTTENQQEQAETAEQKTSREARIKALKETLKVKLASAEKKKIQDRCQGAQGKTSSIIGRFQGIETSRGEVHKNLLNRLNALVEKLKAKSIDTTELEEAIVVLNTKIETFNTDLATYKQAVADLKAIDCKAEPESFKAALAAARTSLEKVRADAKDIRTYLQETIKPILKETRDALEPKTETTDGQGGTQ